MNDKLEVEIERNLFAFLSRIPQLLTEHRGEYAVLRQQEIVGIYARLSEALQVAQARFNDGLFSIQEITDKPVDLGFYSHAADPR
ncbi:MAG: hypothetical protein APF82_02835 [Sphingomonadales bacterium BRH_c42]|nr:MAG: hypothetical protein APF82_02835 [Sphingomonadales bacterium BRH_c42]